MINKLLKLADLLDKMKEEGAADKIAQLIVEAQGYSGLPGGMELDEEGRFNYPDPSMPYVPEIQEPPFDIETDFEPSSDFRRQTGDESVWVEIGEALESTGAEPLEHLANTKGFRIYLVENGKLSTVQEAPDSFGQVQFEFEKAPHEKTQSWNDILLAVGGFDMITSKGHKKATEGFITYEPPGGEEKKVANFRNFERVTIPMAGSPGGAGVEGQVKRPSKAVIQTVGEFEKYRFTTTLIDQILSKSPMEGSLMGEVGEGTYAPDLFPEEGPAVSREVPMGGSAELEGLETAMNPKWFEETYGGTNWWEEDDYSEARSYRPPIHRDEPV
jgi:hypothetical protein